MGKKSMYAENPRLEHDDEGNVKVKRDASNPAAGDTGEPDDAGLDEMMTQHEEMVKMHAKHQADSLARIKKGMTSGSNDVGSPAKDIEKGAK